MTVYVDELRRWPTRIRCFMAGSSHLTADTLEELHAAAERLGLKREWFQDKRVPHYDITPAKRDYALAIGVAVFVPAKEQARRRLAGLQPRVYVVHDDIDELIQRAVPKTRALAELLGEE